MKKRASKETVMAFCKAVYPEMTELAMASNGEEDILKDATAELTRLREENERLNEDYMLQMTRAEIAGDALRRIAGELGEFADADGDTMVEKIRFLRSEIAGKEGG